MKVTGREVPLTVTAVLLAKLLPFTASRKPGPPAPTLEGLSVVIVAAGTVMAKFCGLPEVPPPGCALKISTGTLPDAVTKLAGTLAMIEVLPVTVPGIRFPLKTSCVLPLMKPVPVAVIVTAVPADPDVGLIKDNVGAGAMTLNSICPDVPAGSDTLTECCPAVVSNAAGIVAVS